MKVMCSLTGESLVLATSKINMVEEKTQTKRSVALMIQPVLDIKGKHVYFRKVCDVIEIFKKRNRRDLLVVVIANFRAFSFICILGL